MEIVSHRGYWKAAEEKNSEIAFERSFSLGYGTETDLRDYKEELVISHDIANEKNLTVDNFFKIYKKYLAGTLALNIKADGLQLKLKKLLEEHSIENYFVFDMSIPDTLGYIKEGLAFFSRQSEYELMPAFYDECDGIWLDAFVDTWYDGEIICNHINNNKKVAIVSSELHKRNHVSLWQNLKKNKVHLLDKAILCTDIPEEATKYFFKEL